VNIVTLISRVTFFCNKNKTKLEFILNIRCKMLHIQKKGTISEIKFKIFKFVYFIQKLNL